MIDLHTHVLAGIDDGVLSLEAGVAAVRRAALGGTSTLVATPYIRGGPVQLDLAEIGYRAANLEAALKARGIDVAVLPGAALDVERAVQLSEGELMQTTIAGNGRDLLVETPRAPLEWLFERVLLELILIGFRITLVHAEHNRTFQEEPDTLGRLVQHWGVLVLLTAGTLCERSPAGTAAASFLRNRWAHVLASGLHAADDRATCLHVGLRDVMRAFPDLHAELIWMVTDAPQAIVAGRPLPKRPEREQAPSRAWRVRR